MIRNARTIAAPGLPQGETRTRDAWHAVVHSRGAHAARHCHPRSVGCRQALTGQTTASSVKEKSTHSPRKQAALPLTLPAHRPPPKARRVSKTPPPTPHTCRTPALCAASQALHHDNTSLRPRGKPTLAEHTHIPWAASPGPAPDVTLLAHDRIVAEIKHTGLLSLADVATEAHGSLTSTRGRQQQLSRALPARITSSR